MVKVNYSAINVKAATITGAVVGFIFWIFGLAMGFTSMPMYGFMNGMMGYYMAGYAGFVGLYFLSLIIIGAIIGLLIAVIYNWALKLK